MNNDDRDRLEKLETSVNKVITGIERIELGLFGDEQLGQPGLVNRVQKLETTAEKLENAKWYVLGAIAVIGTIAAAAAWVINIFTNINGAG